MFVLPPLPPPQIEFYQSIEAPHLTKKSSLKHQVQSSTAQFILKTNPKLLLGEAHLFDYNPENHTIELSFEFNQLLNILDSIEELDSDVFNALSLYELNHIFQKTQGFNGGLKRENGKERWHLNDSPNKQKFDKQFKLLFQNLGLLSSMSCHLKTETNFQEITVDHCLIFGARIERMETRILETLKHLQKNLKVSGHIFLLGSNRKLLEEEVNYLKSKLRSLDAHQQIDWENTFNDSNQSTEANAFMFLWRTLVPKELQASLEDRLIGIKSTKTGSSYSQKQGNRVTTEVTIEDWMLYYQEGQPQTIFALAEKPYLRLTDQLRETLLSKSKKATREELEERIKNTTFYFAFPDSKTPPLISVVLDEICRSFFRTVNTLNYLEKLDPQ